MTIAVGNVTTTIANVYASTGNTAITWLSLCNYSAGNVVANVFVVPNGDTAGNLNAVINNILITTGDTYQLYAASEKLLLGNGDSVQVDANVNNAITAVTSYTTI
jgi:hypothetical protein